MFDNPYKFDSPLHPGKDKQVCIYRKDDIDKVIEGLIKGDYWAVLGPKKIGKTTFLRLLKSTFNNAHHIDINVEEAPRDEDSFYRWLMNQMEKGIPSDKIKSFFRWGLTDPKIKFFNFLEKFTPRDDKRIILMFDEIGKTPFASDFLHVWRRVYHERNYKKSLDRYSVIIAGEVDLIALTDGPTSPFNIAKTIYIRDFSEEESATLISQPLAQLNIYINPKATEILVSYMSGHPQLLQHACYILVEKAKVSSNRIINEEEVSQAIEDLKVSNSSLAVLQENIRNNNKLKRLIRDILAGQQKKYYPYKEYRISGAGPLVNKDSYCAIRNNLYEEFLKEILNEKH